MVVVAQFLSRSKVAPCWSRKWSNWNRYWIYFLPLFGVLWTPFRRVTEVNKEEWELEPTETEVNIQEWGLELSAPNPLGQPRRHDVQCVWRTCAPPSCCCSNCTETKAIKYSVNIALVFFQVTFFLLFLVLSFSEWLEVFLLHLMCMIRLS